MALFVLFIPIVFLSLGTAASADSTDVNASQSAVCSDLRFSSAVLDCAWERAPEVLRAQKILGRAEAGLGQAGQIPNPEFSVSGGYGRYLGDTVMNGQADLTFTLELGGKRGARLERAQAEKAFLQAQFFRSKEELGQAVLAALVRLRQLSRENAVMNEALETFRRIRRQYQKRSRLNPEQEVSLGVFELAESDYRLRLADQIAEAARVQNELRVWLGSEATIYESAWISERKDWPDAKALLSSEGTPEAFFSDISRFKGSAGLAAISELKVAEAELSLARAASWPNLKIGPSYLPQVEGPLVAHQFGLNLTFEIPVFNANGGGRAVAHREVERARVSVEQRARELSSERASSLVLYERNLKAFEGIPSFDSMDRRHRGLENLFERGVVSSSLVIEAHRQLVDFTIQKHASEIETLRALWSIYALEGRLLTELLEMVQ